MVLFGFFRDFKKFVTITITSYRYNIQCIEIKYFESTLISKVFDSVVNHFVIIQYTQPKNLSLIFFTQYLKKIF